ncbi:MAG: methionine ABC transporter substrate-binding protein, partial [Veillonella sp.]|nr:methionine ABC transporter substrate-binding protein [Veillonella sp.]
MKLKKFIAPLLVGVLAFAIAGCGTNTNQSSQTPKEIK